jgi:hypothetical protein
VTDILTTRDLRYQYDEKEHLRLAEDLAHEITVLATAERLFGVAKAAHKEAVERMGSTVRDLSRKLSDGWEIRDVVCRLLPNEPEAGKRTIVRADTGELVAIEDMYTGQQVETPVDHLFEVSADSQAVTDMPAMGSPSREASTVGELTGKTQPVSAESILFDPKSEASTEERKRTRKLKVKMQGQDAILPDPRKSQPGAPA